MREVAVAVGDLGALHHEPVDRGQQAAEQGVGRRERDSGSLGHWRPLLLEAGNAPAHHLGTIYVYQMPTTMYLFA